MKEIYEDISITMRVRAKSTILTLSNLLRVVLTVLFLILVFGVVDFNLIMRFHARISLITTVGFQTELRGVQYIFSASIFRVVIVRTSLIKMKEMILKCSDEGAGVEYLLEFRAFQQEDKDRF